MAKSTLELTGDGYGYGSGHGSGYGYGHDSYWKLLLGHPTHKGTRAFWRCTSENTPANGGTGTVAREGLVEEIPGPLQICTANALHGTLDPTKHSGTHWWVIELIGKTQKEDDKLGALKRVFIKNLGRCPL